MIDACVCLLAAGRGQRAGGVKAWQTYQGKTLLERQLEFLLKRFKPDTVSVSIQKEWLDRCRAIESRVQWVAVNPEISPLSALQALLQPSSRANWAFVYHVDMPLWVDGLFEQLSETIAESHSLEAIVPVYNERRGHPVLISPKAQSDLLALDPSKDRLDYWLSKRSAHQVKNINVPYACIHENWNERLSCKTGFEGVLSERVDIRSSKP